ncbi:contactin-6-like isoform X1 [Scyliorhinus canicula]|uniref:contactin-6-like isoform X1 n=1 Tax=Scyliorhinus canicula TaxID=7830 RepID=UPI0018F6779D|nr:contactin-6-like isoform X1 [Scyliorhinus canicula]
MPVYQTRCTPPACNVAELQPPASQRLGTSGFEQINNFGVAIGSKVSQIVPRGNFFSDLPEALGWMEKGLTLWVLLFLSLLALFEEVSSKEVYSIVGSSVLLDLGQRINFTNADLLWEFTTNSKHPITILDYDRHRQKIEPQSQFKHRLYFNENDGSLILSNVKPADQGVYTISVDAKLEGTIELFVSGKMEVYRAPGGSMFFPGVFEEHRNQAEMFKWEVLSGSTENGTRTKVLQFHPNNTEPSFMKKYNDRIDIFPFNGSFILHQLHFSDEGLYTLSTNQQNIIAQTVRLQIIEELSETSILSNTSSLASTIALTCDVSGKPHGYKWQKDGGEISPRHWLINGNRSLIIPSSMKGDCGIYTCLAVNPISSIQADYTLTIYDLPPPLHHTMVLSILALISASVIFVGIMLLCLHHDMKKISVDFHRKVLLFLQVTAMLSFIILFAALLCWIQAEGISATMVVMLGILFFLLILTILSACSMNFWAMKTFKVILNTNCCRVTLDAVTPMGGLIVICTSSILLWEINKLSGKGCEPPPDLHLHISFAVVVPIVITVLIFAIYVQKYRKRRKEQGMVITTAGAREQVSDHLNLEEGLQIPNLDP